MPLIRSDVQIMFCVLSNFESPDNSIAKKWKIRNWRKNAEKLGANLVLNVGPMMNGRLRPEDEKVLLRFETK